MPEQMSEFMKMLMNNPDFKKRLQEAPDEEKTYENQISEVTKENLELAKKKEIEVKFGLRFVDCSFENYNVVTPKQSEAVTKIKEFLRMDKSAGQSLLMCGKSGTGKTHLMVAMAKQIEVEFKAIQFEKLFEKKRVAQSGHQNWYEVVNPWIYSKILFIPDLIVRSSGFTDSQKELLLYLFDERYKNFLPIIISTNVMISELKKALDFEGSNRIVDRLKELISDRVILFDWESHRKLN
jgi:DNA replication protein DnaC